MTEEPVNLVIDIMTSNLNGLGDGEEWSDGEEFHLFLLIITKSKVSTLKANSLIIKPIELKELNFSDQKFVENLDKIYRFDIYNNFYNG
jgi:hypothetical protein